jgi:hypothetical protein
VVSALSKPRTSKKRLIVSGQIYHQVSFKKEPLGSGQNSMQGRLTYENFAALLRFLPKIFVAKLFARCSKNRLGPKGKSSVTTTVSLVNRAAFLQHRKRVPDMLKNAT